MEISKKELQSINGGSISFGAYIIGGGVITFLIGIVDGFLRPLKCNK